MTRNPLVNALAASLYIVCIASLIYGSSLFLQDVDVGIFGPVVFLSLFVLSAACMGFIFLYQPLALFLEGEKQAGVALFLRTTLIFASITASIAILWFAVNSLL